MRATSAGITTQDLTLVYDKVGNLTSRRDRGRSLVTNVAKDVNESFTYDDLNRLKTAQVTGGTAYATTYDNRGNIKTKTQVGTYTYGTSNNRLQSITPASGTAVTYQYDANGNLTMGDGRTIGYTSFDKPHTITKDTANVVKFAYDGERARYKRVVGATTTWYVGNVEVKSLTGGNTQYTRYVEGMAIVTVTRNTTSATRVANSTHYPVTDHLGSIDVILDASGTLLHDLSFDAWGQRRAADPANAVITNPASTLSSLIGITPRGYTGHEMLDTVELIHMNGRVYDPRLGRFLSADPFVQFPSHTQSFNRYAYVLNNPQTYTDPSGYLIKEIFNVVYGIARIVFYDGWTNPQAWAQLAYDLNALANDLGSGSSSNAWVINNLNSVNPSAVAGAYGASATPGMEVSSSGASTPARRLPGTLRNPTVRSSVGGTYSEITGGKYANGAASAAFASVVSETAWASPGEGGSASTDRNSGTPKQADPNRKWANPTGGKVRGCDSQGCGSYGAERDYGPHQAADYEAIPGQDVVAVTDGVVTKVGYPYGDDLSYRFIQIETPDGYLVRQLYTSPAAGIAKGASVSAGQSIGNYQGLGTRYPGITEHVHVDIRHNGQLINPTTVIPGP